MISLNLLILLITLYFLFVISFIGVVLEGQIFTIVHDHAVKPREASRGSCKKQGYASA